MPLPCGRRNIGINISELQRSGRKHTQAVAIALSHQRKCEGKNPRYRRPSNKTKRGFKKCVLSRINRARATTPLQARKAFADAVKKCR